MNSFFAYDEEEEMTALISKAALCLYLQNILLLIWKYFQNML